MYIPTDGRITVGRPAKAYIHHLCVDFVFCQVNLPRVMADRDGY